MQEKALAYGDIMSIDHLMTEVFIEGDQIDSYPVNEEEFVSKRNYIGSIHEVLDIIDKSKKICVLLGAGGSVGPDFRSEGGLYDFIASECLLKDPCSVFNLEHFRKDPSLFWKYAFTIFPPENPRHSEIHYFLENLAMRGKLLRVYSQNVDALEVGLEDDILRCVHGSWRSCHCDYCGQTYNINDIRDIVNKREVPQCKVCGGIIHPGIVFFGEPVLIDDEELYSDVENMDLLIVIGTSLKVAPISQLPKLVTNAPTILINRQPVGVEFDAQLLGECDVIAEMITNELEWSSNDTLTEFQFLSPNLFIFQGDEKLGTRIYEDHRSHFLVTSHPCDIKDLN